MFSRTPRNAGSRPRLLPSPSMAIAGVAMFVALGGSAVAADRLIRSNDIAPDAVTSAKIKNGSVTLADLQSATVKSLRGGTGGTGGTGAAGANGPAGAAGANGLGGANGAIGAAGANGLAGTNGANGAIGAAGANGLAGTNGANGAIGAPGANGLAGTNGANGAPGANGLGGTNGANGAPGANGLGGTNGANGAIGPDGAPGTNGSDGTDGTDGTDGADGVLGPLSATNGLTALPTATPPTTVIQLTVPAGNYVVMAKSEISHTGAGDTVRCTLKAGSATIDEASMKTLPALAAVPFSLQAVTTTAPTQLSMECDVSVANGAANFTSLIALPVS